MSRWYLALDVGTTSVKAAAIAEDGAALAEARAGYGTSRPDPGHVEQDPEAWWGATVEAVRRLLSGDGVEAAEVAGVGLSGMAATHVLLDHDGRVLRPAILWQDMRAVREAEELVGALGEARIRAAFGADLPLTAAAQAARMLWLARHEPQVWERTAAILGAKDYVAFRLTGELATDPTSVSGFASLVDGRLAPDMAHATRTDPALLPPVLPPHGVAGVMTAAAAEATALPAGTRVVIGMMDSWCAMVGSGVRGTGDAFDTAGTAEVVGVAGPRCPRTTTATIYRLPFLTGVDVIYGVTQCGTDAFTWYAELLGQSSQEGFERLGAAAAAVPPGSGGLLFLPHLEGERSPFSDARARGSFLGVHRRHGEGQLARAVLEGVAYSVRHVLEASEAEAGLEAQALVVAGGGAKSRLWNQIKADVLQRPLMMPRVLDAGSVGAAVLARAGIEGIELIDAIDAMVGVAATFEPDAERARHYDACYSMYVDASAGLRELHARLVDHAAQEVHG
jgi:xylulokinase